MCDNCSPLKNCAMIRDAIKRRIPEQALLSVTHKPMINAYSIGVEGIPICSFVSFEDESRELRRVVNNFVEYVNNWYEEHKKEMGSNNRDPFYWDLELKKLVEEER